MAQEKRNHSFMLVGPVGAGKSTLFRALGAIDGEVRKTQAIEYGDEFGVDTPGEFFSSRWYHSVLTNMSGDIETLIYVHPADVLEVRMPPGLLTVHGGKGFVTVITKIDEEGASPDFVEEMLRANGIKDPIFRLSGLKPKTVEPLRKYLKLV